MNKHEENKIFKLLEKIMSAITVLNANISKLDADVKVLVASKSGVPEAQVQAAADAVAAIDVEVLAATPAV